MNQRNPMAAEVIRTPSVQLSDASPTHGAEAERSGIRVDRAVSELRHGRAVIVEAAGERILVATVETLLPSTWTELAAGESELRITLTAERAHASGWHEAAGASPSMRLLPISLPLPATFDSDRLADLAGIGHHRSDRRDIEESIPGFDSGLWPDLLADQGFAPLAQTTQAMGAGLELARLARLVPAIVTSNGVASGSDDGEDRSDPSHLRVSAADIDAYPQHRANSLLRVSEAVVPLAGHENSRFVLFRETAADLEHVAVIVGDPDPQAPVLVRLHSSCLTGDLFGSLRCDCGDQLRGAVERLGERGGVLLYLAQEGRGIGLANKLRAYARQDAGLDTIDADRYLGFRGDERNFAIAVQMLKDLGIDRVRLLTNNPAKIAALREAGLDVVERLPIGGEVNRHNERYITTKRDRAGHLIDVSTLPAQRQAS